MKRQRGMALLVVLLMLALMVIVATSVAEHTGTAYQRTDSLLTRTQARWTALGAEALMGSVLLRDGQDSPKITFIGQPWSRVDRQILDDGREMVGQIYDGSTCLNLNALQPRPKNTLATGPISTAKASEKTPYAAQVFRQLMVVLGEKGERADAVTAAVRDWLDEDHEPRANGAEDDAYSRYQPANQPMADVSELRAINGVDSDLYRRLLPYVCVLPVDTFSININTLTQQQAPLLSAMLMGKFSPEEAARVVALRPAKGWQNVDAFVGLPQLPESGKSNIRQALAVKSDWFFGDVRIQGEEGALYQRSLFHRHKRRIDVIQRQYGGYRTMNR